MNMKLLAVSAASSALLLAGCSAGGAAMSPAMSPEMTPSAMSTPTAMMEPSGSMSPTGMMMSASHYVTYDTWSGSMSAYASTTQVLFFYSAGDAASKTIDAALTSDVAALGEGVTVVKVNLDAMMKTADKYQVDGPHTFVVLAADGSAKVTFPATTVAELMSQLKS